MQFNLVYRKMAIYKDRWKLIWNRWDLQDQIKSFYDLVADPAENNDLYGTGQYNEALSDLVNRGESFLYNHRDVKLVETFQRGNPKDEAIREDLRSLGYLQ